jgi:peptidoglycan/LPS O-acetylase OafA/YrhL
VVEPSGRHFEVLIPTWSLAVEEQFYALWPLLVYLTPERRFRRVVVAALVAAPVVRAALTFVTTDHWAVYYLLPTRIDGLAGGALLACLLHYAPSTAATVRRWSPRVTAAAVGLFGVLTISLPGFRTGRNGLTFNVIGYTLCVAAACGLVGWVLSLRPATRAYRMLTARPIQYLGSISYTMYLVHEMALHTARARVAGTWGPAVVALAGTVAIGAASWHLVEAPILRLKDRLVPTGAASKARSAVTEPLRGVVGR